MYLRYTTRRKGGKVHKYWTLVRSVRVGRRVIQQTVAHLGELDAKGRLQARALARHLIGARARPALRRRHARCDGACALEGDCDRALAAIRRCLSRACSVARDWFGGSVPALAAGRQRAALGEDRSRPGRSPPLRALKRAAYCRGLVSAHSALGDLLLMRRSTRIGSIVRWICSWSTKRPWKRICRSAAASCFRSRMKCCSMT